MPSFARIVLAICLTTCLNAQVAYCDPPELPVWSSSETELPLGLQPDAVQIQLGSLNLPSDWKQIGTTTFASKRELYKFGNGEVYKVRRRAGPLDGAGLSEYLTVTTEIAGGVGPDWAPEAAIREATAPITDRLFNMVATKIQHGIVRGRPAVRCYVSGDYDLEPNRHTLGAQAVDHQVVPVHIFAYVIGDANINTSFVGFDIDPNSKQNLPKLEQSVLTFQQGVLEGTAMGQPKKPTSWTPDPLSYKYLLPLKSYGGITLCAPKFGDGPAKMTMADNAGKPLPNVTGYVWLINDSDASPALFYTINMLKPGEAPPPLEDVTAGIAESTGDALNLDNYTHTKPEYGYTGYGHTARFYAGGKRAAGKISVQEELAVYVFVSGNAVVVLKAMDDIPPYSWLPTLENSILTGSIPGAEKAPQVVPEAPVIPQTPIEGTP